MNGSKKKMDLKRESGGEYEDCEQLDREQMGK